MGTQQRVFAGTQPPGVIPPGLGGATTEPGVARGAVTSDWNSSAQTMPVSSRRRPQGQLCTGDPFPWRFQLQDTVQVLGLTAAPQVPGLLS